MSMPPNPGLAQQGLRTNIRRWIIFFMAMLILSGITAFPIETGLGILIGHKELFPPYMQHWLGTIYDAVKSTNERFPYLAYGTDWLAFAHIVIAIAFVGPWRDPVRNIWVIQFGMIACILILPLAFIAGPVRQIPFFWQLIDCSFGVFGLIPLYICYKNIKKLEYVQLNKSSYIRYP